MRALVIGGDGGLALALRAQLAARGCDVVWTTRRSLLAGDLHEHEEVMHLDMLDPVIPESLTQDVGHNWVVYIMAAITGMVPAERHPDAWRINAYAPLALARQAHAHRWHVVFPSTGAVELAPHMAAAYQKTYAEVPILMWGGCVVRILPRVPAEKYAEVADLLFHVGEEHRSGLVRWEG